MQFEQNTRSTNPNPANQAAQQNSFQWEFGREKRLLAPTKFHQRIKWSRRQNDEIPCAAPIIPMTCSMFVRLLHACAPSQVLPIVISMHAFSGKARNLTKAVTGRGPQLANTCVGSKTLLMLAHARQGLAHVPYLQMQDLCMVPF
jgi:hypothetical protein